MTGALWIVKHCFLVAFQWCSCDFRQIQGYSVWSGGSCDCTEQHEKAVRGQSITHRRSRFDECEELEQKSGDLTVFQSSSIDGPCLMTLIPLGPWTDPTLPRAGARACLPNHCSLGQVAHKLGRAASADLPLPWMSGGRRRRMYPYDFGVRSLGVLYCIVIMTGTFCATVAGL